MPRTIIIILFTVLLFSCSQQKKSKVVEIQPTIQVDPQLWLHLDGWDATTIGINRASAHVDCENYACQTWFKNTNTLEQIEAFLPASSKIQKTLGVLQHVRPSRTPRMRMQSVACPGEALIANKSGKPGHQLKVLECKQRQVFIDPGRVFVLGPGGKLEQAIKEKLSVGQVRTWLWQESGEWWAVSVGVLYVDEKRVIWHREGPVRNALFGAADRIALRDGQIDIYMQADFLLGSLRALFTTIRRSPHVHVQAVITETADLEEALAMAPGSWAAPLRERFASEILEFAQERAVEGWRVFFSGATTVTPVVRRVDPAVFAELAERMRTTPEGVEFAWVQPGENERRWLENTLAKIGLTPQNDVFLRRVPDGWRLELPLGWKVGSCPRGKPVCFPTSEEGARVAASWIRSWCAFWPSNAVSENP